MFIQSLDVSRKRDFKNAEVLLLGLLFRNWEKDFHVFSIHFLPSSGSSSSCLNDHPLKDVSGSRANHNKLPGQVYDSDAQCALQFGASYKLCPRMRVSRYS